MASLLVGETIQRTIEGNAVCPGLDGEVEGGQLREGKSTDVIGDEANKVWFVKSTFSIQMCMRKIT